MNKKNMLFLKKYVFKDNKYFGLICVVTLVQSIIIMLVPYLTKCLMDDVFPGQKNREFYLIIIIMLICYIFSAGFNVLKDYLLAIISERIALRLRTKINNKISSMNYNYFDKYSLGDVLSRYGKEVDVIKNSCGDMLTRTISNMATFLLASLMITVIEWKIMVLTFVTLFFYFWNNKYWGKRVKSYAEKVLQFNEEAINTVTENYQNALLTKLYRAYHYTDRKFQETYNKQYKSQIGLEVTYSLNVNISNFLIYFISILIWFIGGKEILKGNMSVGEITALLSYQGMLVSPMAFFSEMNNSFNSTLVAIDRLASIFEVEDEKKEGVIINDQIDSITFKNIGFGYENRDKSFINVNFELLKGKAIALVGASGCGKSTLVKLLLKLYPPTEGEILINGTNIEECSVESLRKKIAFVAQDSLFFNDSIRNNIDLGEKIENSQVIMLAQMIDIVSEIESMPDKWDTQIVNGGNNLSGGQKKRLDIIRALVRDSDIMIFDESTASIDQHKRKKLFDFLLRIKKEKIIIFITHNVEEYLNFDDVYVIENKTIIKK